MAHAAPSTDDSVGGPGSGRRLGTLVCIRGARNQRSGKCLGSSDALGHVPGALRPWGASPASRRSAGSKGGARSDPRTALASGGGGGRRAGPRRAGGRGRGRGSGERRSFPAGLHPLAAQPLGPVCLVRPLKARGAAEPEPSPAERAQCAPWGTPHSGPRCCRRRRRPSSCCCCCCCCGSRRAAPSQVGPEAGQCPRPGALCLPGIWLWRPQGGDGA